MMSPRNSQLAEQVAGLMSSTTSRRRTSTGHNVTRHYSLPFLALLFQTKTSNAQDSNGSLWEDDDSDNWI